MLNNIYIGCGGDNPLIGVIDCSDGSITTFPLAPDTSISCMDISDDGHYVICGTANGYINRYIYTEEGTLSDLSALYVGSAITNIANFPNGKIYSLDTSGRLICWRVSEFDIQFNIITGIGPVRMLSKVSNDRLACICDRIVRMYDVATSECISEFNYECVSAPDNVTYWSKFGVMVIAGASGVAGVDVNNGSQYEFTSSNGDWYIFTSGDYLYLLDNYSNVIYRYITPESSPEQAMLYAGVKDIVMVDNNIITLDNNGAAAKFTVTDEGFVHNGHLPLSDCIVLAKSDCVYESVKNDNNYQEKVSDLQRGLVNALKYSDINEVDNIVVELSNLGQDEIIESIVIGYYRETGDVASELAAIINIIDSLQLAVPDNLVLRLFEIMTAYGMYELASTFYDRFEFAEYSWQADVKPVVDSGEYIIDSGTNIAELAKISYKIGFPIDGNYILSRCEIQYIPEIEVSCEDLMQKITDIASKNSIVHCVGHLMNIDLLSGKSSIQSQMLSFASFNIADNYIIFPALRYCNCDSGTAIEPVTILSVCYQGADVYSHNKICSDIISKYQGVKPEYLWPDYICDIISEAICRLKNSMCRANVDWRI